MGESMTGGKNQVEEKYILTIDMGTTAFKSAIFDCRGREVSSATEEYRFRRRSRDGQRWIRTDILIYFRM